MTCENYMKSKFHTHRANFVGLELQLFFHLLSTDAFVAMITKMDSCDRNSMAHEALNIYSFSLYRKADTPCSIEKQQQKLVVELLAELKRNP